jgi:hypothetical protein
MVPLSKRCSARLAADPSFTCERSVSSRTYSFAPSYTVRVSGSLRKALRSLASLSKAVRRRTTSSLKTSASGNRYQASGKAPTIAMPMVDIAAITRSSLEPKTAVTIAKSTRAPHGCRPAHRRNWMRRLNGVNNAAIRRVDATTARVDCWPVNKTKSLCNTTITPK